MIFLPIIILALVQGLTEFLPVSSSGHLVLVHAFFDAAKSWDEKLILDVAVHVGTLLSVLLYFRADVAKMLLGALSWLKGDFKTEGGKLNFYIIIASIPVIAGGLAMSIIKPEILKTVEVMAWATIVFGVLLWVADRSPRSDKTVENMNLKDAILIGLAQSLALVPGTSRSGITMTAARFLGYSRPESAHFSLLLAIIAISGAGAIGAIDLVQNETLDLGPDVALAVALSFLSGWLAISIMMKFLEKASFTLFAVYRILLGCALLALVYQVGA
jgi:undecaprenyl-diphosphatase